MIPRFYKVVLISILLSVCISASSRNCIPYGTNINLSSQSQIDSFPINFPGCTVVNGSITISGNNILNLNGLSGLKKIYSLEVRYSPSLVNLNGLNNVDTVLSLNIENNITLTSLTGLDGLMYSNNISISDNPLLLNFTGLGALKKVENGSFWISGNTSLINFVGLNSLIEIFSLSVYNNDSLIDLNGLQSLKTLDNFAVNGNLSLINLFGLNNITNLNQGAIISGNPSLINLNGLNNLDSSSSISIHGNNSLTNFIGLENLKSTALFDVSGNNNLISFVGIDSLIRSNWFFIQDNPLLETLNGVNPSIHIDEIWLKNNPKLSCCFLAKLILENNPNMDLIDIQNNDTGCSSEAEVRALTTSSTCCITTIFSVSRIICQGESIKVGAHVYSVSGIYKDTFKIGATCDSIVTTHLTIRPKSYQVKTLNLCTGQQITLSNGKIITISGIYNDSIPNICDSIIEYHVSFSNNITVNQNVIICQGRRYTLPGGNEVANSGIYKDTLQSSFGCDSIVITNLSVTNSVPFDTTVSICEGQIYKLPGGKKITVAGDYTDTIQNADGCDSVVVTHLSFFPNIFTVQLNATDTIDAGASTELNPSYSNGIPLTWNWTPVSDLSCTACEDPLANPVQTTTYIVNVRSEDGCEDTAQTKIIVQQTDIYMPAAFTPNNDGLNDVVDVFVKAPVLFHISIFNRWGAMVFESNSLLIKWDGIFNGTTSPADDYMFVVDATSPAGKKMHKQGIITLIR
ncbi:MAG: large protein [Bacteroidota bacterium]|nr:large protein [Bacteroidota bacterium]